MDGIIIPFDYLHVVCRDGRYLRDVISVDVWKGTATCGDGKTYEIRKQFVISPAPTTVVFAN
jgi:hypothetical protein